MYNVEMYIEKCLKSCINQNVVLGEEYEIICIDDGSPDRSGNIAEKVASCHNGISVIHQKNQGLSGARNTGFDNAKGKYVWFVDSDDYIEKNCLCRICEYLKDDLDILQLRYRHVFENGGPNIDISSRFPKGVFDGHEITLTGGVPAPAQFSIYRTQFLKDNQLRFVSGIYHEDSEFKPRAVVLAKKIAFDQEISYNYLQRLSGSIMSSFSLKRAKDVIFVNRSLFNFSRKLAPPLVVAFNAKIGMNMNSLFVGYHLLPSKERREVKEIFRRNKVFFKCMINSNNLKYRLEGYLFSLSISLGLFFHRLLK